MRMVTNLSATATTTPFNDSVHDFIFMPLHYHMHAMTQPSQPSSVFSAPHHPTRGRRSLDLPHSLSIPTRMTVSRPRALTDHSSGDDGLSTSHIPFKNSQADASLLTSHHRVCCSQARHLMSRHKPFFHSVVHSLFKTARTLLGTNH
jgi:hypothetical protein